MARLSCCEGACTSAIRGHWCAQWSRPMVRTPLRLRNAQPADKLSLEANSRCSSDGFERGQSRPGHGRWACCQSARARRQCHWPRWQTWRGLGGWARSRGARRPEHCAFGRSITCLQHSAAGCQNRCARAGNGRSLAANIRAQGEGCAAATIRVAPTPALVVASVRSRRWGDHAPLRLVNVSAPHFWWPVFRCPRVTGQF